MHPGDFKHVCHACFTHRLPRAVLELRPEPAWEEGHLLVDFSSKTCLRLPRTTFTTRIVTCFAQAWEVDFHIGFHTRILSILV